MVVKNKVTIKTKFKLDQEVYYIRSVPRKMLTCAACSSYKNEYHKVVVKAKIKDITFSGNLRKYIQNNNQYQITGGNNYFLNEKDIFATKEEAEAKRGKVEGIY